MIFPSYEIRTHKTIATSRAVFYKITFPTIFGIRGIITAETFFTIEALVQFFTIVNVAAIDDIF